VSGLLINILSYAFGQEIHFVLMTGVVTFRFWSNISYAFGQEIHFNEITCDCLIIQTFFLYAMCFIIVIICIIL
jgi:hypothetical protein